MSSEVGAWSGTAPHAEHDPGATVDSALDTTVDVAIVGAGPAGTAAAITLARSGRSVVVIDKARFPRDKCCGDGLTTGALRRLERLGLDPAKIPSWTWVDRFELSSPRRRVSGFELPVDGRFAAVAMRVELDSELVRLARAAGARIVEDAPLTSISGTGSPIRLIAAEGRVRVTARQVIAADGVWSPTRKLLGVERLEAGATGESSTYLGEWHGYRQYAKNVHTIASRDLWIWFERDLVPGYLWSFPLANGRVNLGFGIERTDDRPTKEMKELWPDLLRRPHVRRILGPDVELEGRPKAWPIPASVGSASLAEGAVLFVGDAARAGDVLTGEGIGQALQTGIAAAEAIVASDDPVSAGGRYSASALDELGPDHRMASWLQRAMSNRHVAEAAIRISASSPWTRRNFGRWLFEDYARGIALTPTHWRWGLMSGQGAYPDTSTRRV